MLKEKQDKTDIGVIVGRFHVHTLHEGHINLIDHVKKNHDKTIIILGVAPVRHTFNNPLAVKDRRAMLAEKYPDIDVYYVNDSRSDEVWSKNLDKVIREAKNPTQTVMLYGSRDSFIAHYSGKFRCKELESDIKVSATEVRRQIANYYPPTKDFRAGVIAATTYSYPATLPTVDVAIFDWTKTKILLGKKADESRYRFIGGHAEPTSDTYEADVRREVEEEAGCNITDPKYIGSALIDDWRYRNERSKIKTLFFWATYQSGRVEAGDDIAEVAWFDLHDVEGHLMEEHLPLHTMLLTHIENGGVR